MIAEFLTYIQANAPDIWGHTLDHLRLTTTAVAISIIIGVPLGILISYIKQLYKPIVGFANVVQAVPSLALLGFLIPLLGIGALPGISMVVVYSLLPIIKNTSTGLNGVDRDTLEAARGIGLTQMQILLRVKLPLALPIIMTGIRVAAVTAVGLVTIAAFIGAGGLGYLVYSGVRMVNNFQILSGAIPACLMALLIDFAFSLVEGAVTPVSLRRDIKSFDRRRIQQLKIRKNVILAGAVVCLGLIAFANLRGHDDARPAVVVAGKDYTEQTLLGNIFAELIEDRTNLRVVRQLDLGGTGIVFNAMRAGEVDLYVEYTGTAYAATLGYSENTSAEETYRIMVEEFKDKFDIDVLDPLGFNNTYAMMVTPETAAKYNLKTISDMARVSHELVCGPTMEFMNRWDGLLGLTRAYNLQFRDVKGFDGGSPRYAAIMSGQTHTSDAFSTDGTLIKFDMVLLEDDKKFFPPYQAAPVIRGETLKKYPELREAANALAGRLNDDKMRRLNYEVEVEGKNPREVAVRFLIGEGLIAER